MEHRGASEMLQNRTMVSFLTLVAKSLLKERVRCCLLLLDFGTWGDILAGVRTLNNSLPKFKDNLFFTVGDWRDFFSSQG